MAAKLEGAPGAEASFVETLPPALASGEPRLLCYSVELVNRKGRSAGMSNTAVVAAGQAPAAVKGLSAAMRKDGVLLNWTPRPEAQATVIRLKRKLIGAVNPPAKSGQSLLTPPAEPVEEFLVVPAGSKPGEAIDRDVRFGETYEYQAQSVAELIQGGKKVELAGPLSAPVRIAAEDKFPPAVPIGLAAVATPGENGAAPGIDLSWQPDAEADLAGYLVYRRLADGGWQRISPTQPVPTPGYHDSDVQPGQTYWYAVSAISQQGYESARSAETQETVPEP
jgi:hypothetical protein